MHTTAPRHTHNTRTRHAAVSPNGPRPIGVVNHKMIAHQPETTRTTDSLTQTTDSLKLTRGRFDEMEASSAPPQSPCTAAVCAAPSARRYPLACRAPAPITHFNSGTGAEAMRAWDVNSARITDRTLALSAAAPTHNTKKPRCGCALRVPLQDGSKLWRSGHRREGAACWVGSGKTHQACIHFHFVPISLALRGWGMRCHVQTRINNKSGQSGTISLQFRQESYIHTVQI